MAGALDAPHIVRIFVSSPGDVAAERARLTDVVEAINRTQAHHHGVHYQLHRWETSVVPKVGPAPQAVVNAQTPDYDIFLGIMWGQFGTPTGEHGSGTEEELRHALARWEATGAPWILFYFRDDPPPVKTAAQSRQQTQVLELREELSARGIRGTYRGVDGSSESFVKKVDDHLRLLLVQHFALPPDAAATTAPVASAADPTLYLRDMLGSTAHIEIRGLATGEARAHRFPIDELFVALKALPSGGGRVDAGTADPAAIHGEALRAGSPVALEAALAHRTLVVVGDPGSGKSTFLRRVAQGLSRTLLGIDPDAVRWLGGLERPLFPILLRAEDLARYIAERQDERGAAKPAARYAAAWLPRFLATCAEESPWDLPKDFFQRRLKAGGCIVLIDGLDEAPNRVGRQEMSRVIEAVASTYRDCHVVVTSRPGAYEGASVLAGFNHTRIEPLDDAQIAIFLQRWCSALYGESAVDAQKHRDDLVSALRHRSDIRRMARTPVMLTALAVVYWNERRLPEQRADLYGSVITWLARSREQRPERPKADRAVVLLSELAITMQANPNGRRVQMSHRLAAEAILSGWSHETSEPERLRRAERFLESEELDSGIVVRRGADVRFWHLTFQEFLAAKALAGQPDEDQWKVLDRDDRLWRPEWREVVLLLGGLLHEQGRAKIDAFLGRLLGSVPETASLADKARCVGLAGAIVLDLAPLGYEPSDARFQQLLQDVLGVFDSARASGVAVSARIEAAEALGRAGDPRLDPGRPGRYVRVPAGAFLMGAQKSDTRGDNFDADAAYDESPVHEVVLDEFQIGRYPVTVGEYARFVEDDGYDVKHWWVAGAFRVWTEPGDWVEQLGHPNRPVVNVSWYEASAFAVWAGGRLPTEAEWERAARGTDGRIYPWGNEAASVERLNCAVVVGRPTPVGIYPEGGGPGDIQDMAGNVCEWCNDRFSHSYYVSSQKENPQGPEHGTTRVMRGGSWDVHAGMARSSHRHLDAPSVRGPSIGFRLVIGVVRAR